MSLLYNHSKELNDTLNEFKEDTSNTDWILFGYKGDDLTLVSSGCKKLHFFFFFLYNIIKILMFIGY